MIALAPSPEKLQHLLKQSRIIGLGGALLCVLGVILTREQFFLSYLFAFLFWLGIAIGCLGLSLMHDITGGAWGDVIKPMLRAGAMTLPWFLLFMIPIFFGLKTLYPWARPDLVAADPILQHKQVYLNIPFFGVRALLFLLFWSWLAWFVTPRRSAPGLVFYFLTVTFACVDWIMSLEPHWSSTIYEAMVMMGWALAAFAFVICLLSYFRPTTADPGVEDPKPYLDLGNIVLAFVMFWAYMNFSQYLIIWSGNMPEEISWYLHRQQGGWFWVAMALIAFQFTLPFLLLLARRNKRRLHRLLWIAVMLLIIQAVNTFWLVQPPFHPEHFHIHWLDFAAPAGVGGLWMLTFVQQLQRQAFR